ncbi:MAG: hypothetical protein Q8P26_03275 [Candidatus Levybacteria bacterium]|nr:hypothetical protein [Candidatus Levybacteria bacterium]
MHFDLGSVAVTTITYYPKWYKGALKSIKHTDKIRGDLALEFIGKGSSLGYKMIVVNGGSPKTFSKELSRIKDILVVKRRGKKRSPGKRMGIKIASKLPEIKIIVISEAEKVSLITDCIRQIVSPIINNISDIVVPKREKSLFKSTYPDYMVESEIEGNRIYNEILVSNNLRKPGEEDLDMFFGPRALRNDKKIVSMFMKKYNIFSSEYFNSEEWSNTLYFPIVHALSKRLRVDSVTIPFAYPKIQKENENASAEDVFIEKRRAQRMGLVIELLHFMNYIKKEEVK